MTKPVQFTFTPEQMAHFLAWRAHVEADTGRPVTGVVFSFLVSHQGNLQLIVRPSTEQDFKLPNVPRIDGTYDTFAPHEEELAAYDDLSFAARPPSCGARWGYACGSARGPCWRGARRPGAMWNVWASRSGRSSPSGLVSSRGCWQRIHCARCSRRRLYPRLCPTGLWRLFGRTSRHCSSIGVGRPIAETCSTPCNRQRVLPRRRRTSSVADGRPPVV